MSAPRQTRAAWGVLLAIILAACAPFGACGEASSPAPSVSTKPRPSLTFTPTSIDFHDQVRGAGSSGLSVVVHIANAGSGSAVALGALSVQPDGYVTITRDGCSNQTLAPGATCSVELDYPAANAPLGAFSGALIVPDGIPPDGEAKLSLKGNLEQM